MTEPNSTTLRKKGWNERDIRRALDILNEPDERRNNAANALDRIVYWVALIIAIIGNLIVSIILIPFLLVLKTTVLLIIVAVLGLVFGALFNIIISDIRKNDSAQHIIAEVFIPLLALMNIYFMANMANSFIKALNISTQHNSIMISVTYAFFFILPFVIERIKTNLIIEEP